MYAAVSLKTFAISMIGLFIPIFLMVERGLALNDIILFYVFNTIAYIIAAPFAGRFGAKHGLRKAALLTVPLFAFFYYAIYNITAMPLSYNHLGFILGVAETFFWIPFVTHFMRSSDHTHRTEEISFLNIVTVISGMAGPFIGGLLIAFGGFPLLFGLAIGILLISVIPLGYLKDQHEPFACKLKDILHVPKEDSLKLIARGGIMITEIVFWPIFLFSVVGLFAELGLIFFIAEFGAFLGSFYLGTIKNRKELAIIIRWGAFLCASIWLARTLIDGVLILSILTILGATLHEMIEVPFNTATYDRVAKKKYLGEYVIYRGIMMGVGRLFVLGLLSLSGSMVTSFLTTAAMYLTYLF